MHHAVSCTMRHITRITHHASCIMCHTACNMLCAPFDDQRCIMQHATRNMQHATRTTQQTICYTQACRDCSERTFPSFVFVLETRFALQDACQLCLFCINSRFASHRFAIQPHQPGHPNGRSQPCSDARANAHAHAGSSQGGLRFGVWGLLDRRTIGGPNRRPFD